jgi:hypothetical protein
MNEHKSQVPIAIDRESKKLVNAKDVPNGLACNCFCFYCQQDLVAVNKEIKQKAHFRHNKDSSCELSYEQYIHWLTKEVFKEIDHVILPPIKISDLHQEHQNNIFKKLGFDISENYYSDIYKNEFVLQPASEIAIEKLKTEYTYHTKKGDIRVDIVVEIKNDFLLIEPYYSCKIDDVKLGKISELDKSTISINLLPFYDRHKWLFNIAEFKHFLINDISDKKWEFVRTNKSESLISKFLTQHKNEINRIRGLMESNKKIKQSINEKQKKVNTLVSDIKRLEREIVEIKLDGYFKFIKL